MSPGMPSATPNATLQTTTEGAPAVGAVAGNSSRFELAKVRCRVHPSVIMTILDAHGRLRGTHEFAIGTLLGSVVTEGSSKGIVVEVVDCFANPYHWDKAASALTIQKEQHEWMLKLREKINPKLAVVGWCCTTDLMLYTTALSDWARAEQKVSRFQPTKVLPDPIHILINPTFKNQKSVLGETKAFVRGPLRQLFHEVPLQVSLNTADKLGIGSIFKYQGKLAGALEKEGREALSSDVGSSMDLVTSLKNLQSLLLPALDYVDTVLKGEKSGDAEVGRLLMRTLCADTLLNKEELDSVCEVALQDNLMLGYLTNLARLQLVAAEKLNTSFFS